MDYTKNAVEVVANAIKEREEEQKKRFLEECKARCIDYEVNANVIKVVPIEDIIEMLEGNK